MQPDIPRDKLKVTVSFKARENAKRKKKKCCTYFNIKIKQQLEKKYKLISKSKVAFDSLDKHNLQSSVYFEVTDEFVANLRSLKIFVQFKNKQFIATRRLKEVVIDCNDFRARSGQERHIEQLNGFDVTINADVRKAFNHKEINITETTELNVTHFF